MNDFKQRCITLRKQDYTLPEIVKITGRSKTSVYFHIRDIPLSKEKQRVISDESSNRARKLSADRKGKSNRAFKTFDEWDTNKVLLVAHLSFDGSITRYACMYSNRSAALVSRVKKLMVIIYDFKPRKSKNVKTGVYNISYSNVALSAYLENKAKRLLQEVHTLSYGCRKAFLKAFFDDEGCMDFKPSGKTRRIRGYQKDTRILYLVQKLLEDVGIESKVCAPNEVVIVGKQNLQKFQKEINFSPEVRINGKRSNSVWGESLEKREILKMAIDSFL